jgi:phospholipase/carboxylesterase
LSEGLAQLLRPASAEPQGALVLLHGRGTDEHDLFPLLDLLDPERKLLGATVRGPLSLPPGGAHWYAVRQIGYPDPETFHATYPRLCYWLDGLLDEHGLDHDRLVLGGFSQGTVMSYAAGLGAGRPAPAALIAMSGFMPTVEGFALDLEDRSGLRVALSHGERDPVIGVEWGRGARDRLTAAGAEVLYHEFGGGHHVDPRFMAGLPAWIEGSLAHISG